jgi:hypothetical protein
MPAFSGEREGMLVRNCQSSHPKPLLKISYRRRVRAVMEKRMHPARSR